MNNDNKYGYSYSDIDPGMYPGDIAACLRDLANEYETGAGEMECKHKSDTAKMCRKVADILMKTAEKLDKLEKK